MTQTNLPSPRTVDEYIAGFPPEIQAILRRIRQVIREAAPEAKEEIKYGMPSYTLDGPLVSFAAYRNHIGLYSIPAGDAKFQRDVSAYKAHKSTVRLPFSQPVPYELITRLVKFRREENRERKTTSRR